MAGGMAIVAALVILSPARRCPRDPCYSGQSARLAEYTRYQGAVVEIQVRTILQHAWAELEHDIQYTSSTAIPKEIRRRFMALAGVLEVADREFQAIQDADKVIVDTAREMVDRGDLAGVEITPVALKQFLDKNWVLTEGSPSGPMIGMQNF